jgi:hypothetical protein
MILTEYFEISRIFQRFLFSREGVFRQFSDNFPSAFRQEIKIRSSSSGPGVNLCPPGLQSATLPLRHTYFMSSQFCQHYLIHCQSMSYFVSNVLIVFTFASAVFSFASILFTFVRTLFTFVNIVFFFVSLPPSRLSFSSSVLC